MKKTVRGKTLCNIIRLGTIAAFVALPVITTLKWHKWSLPHWIELVLVGLALLTICVAASLMSKKLFSCDYSLKEVICRLGILAIFMDFLFLAEVLVGYSLWNIWLLLSDTLSESLFYLQLLRACAGLFVVSLVSISVFGVNNADDEKQIEN